MSESVNLPALGESVTEGTVTRWLKQVGDRVEVDEPLLEVSTDKVDTEIPSPIAGVIEEILVAEDETAEVGAPLVRIGDGSGSAAAPAAEAAPAQEAPAESPSAAEAPAPEAEAPAPAAEPAAEATPAGEGHEVTLPALGESVTEGTVTRWLKSVGDSVEVDEPLLEVSTDKVDTEIPSPVAGTLQEIRVAEDETAEVGSVLAVIGSGAAAPAAAPAPEAPKQEAPKQEAPQQEAPKQEAPAPEAPKQEAPKQEAPKQEASKQETAPAESGYVTPLVRKLANQHGVDISSLAGTGVGGRIRKQDVLAAAEAKATPAASAPAASSPAAASAAGSPAAASPAAASPRGTVQKAPRIRQVIARRMRESLDISTQLTQVHEVDMTKVAKLRAKAKNSFQAHAGNLNLAGLAGKIADVADRTRNGKIGPDELSGGTFSITNIGSVGALFDTPIINQPQVAILGTGAIVKRAVVVSDENGDDSIAIRSMMYLSLTYDHRLVDGADAGRFLQTLKARLEEGAFEADLGL
jgi:pyruvate dehydrogenase E2 component (dihydrolipoamide acetyltransferase)